MNKNFLSLIIFLSLFSSAGSRAETQYVQEYIPPRTLCGNGHIKSSPSALAFVDGGKKLYMTDSVAHRMLIVSAETNHIENELQTPGTTNEIFVAPDSHTAYVHTSIPTAGYDKQAILIIDTANDKITKSLEIGDVLIVFGLSPDGKELYFSDGSSKDLSAVDLTDNGHLEISNIRSEHMTDTALHRMENLARDPGAVAGSHLYAYGHASLNVLSLKTGKIETSIPLEKTTALPRLSVNAEGSLLAVTEVALNGTDFNGVILIRTSDNTKFEDIPLQTRPIFSFFSADGKLLYVLLENRLPDDLKSEVPSLLAIETDTGEIVAKINTDEILQEGVASPDRQCLYLLSRKWTKNKDRTFIEDKIKIFDAKTKALRGAIPIPVPEAAGKSGCS